jgi:hypothetical protein
MRKKKLKKNFTYYFFLILIIIFVFTIFEISLRLIVKQTHSFNCYEKTNDQRQYENGKNCYFVEKYFEKKRPTIYKTDSNRFRISTQNIEKQFNKIYFVGDSFTFGHLSDYEETYPFNAIKYLNENNYLKYQEINMGVNGYQFRQNIFLIKKIKEKNLDNFNIIYGLTPNDLFDLEQKQANKNKINLVDYIKIRIDKINLVSVKILTSVILKNDNLYSIIHNNRGVAAGYLTKNSSIFWDEKYEIFENEIKNLPKEIKEKLIITIIPQQAQIRLLKNNSIEDGLSFDNKILSICNRIKVRCVSITKELSEKMNYITHYTLDGHLLPSSNIEYGRLLGKYLLSINYL